MISLLWNTRFQGITAPDGNTFLQLDARSGFPNAIYQDLFTEQGKQYKINFSRGTGFASESEKVHVDWCGKATRSNGYNVEQAGVWRTVSIAVVGTGGVCRLVLRELPNGNDGLGVLLDAVSFGAVDVGPAVSNLVVDGSFEDNAVPANSSNMLMSAK